MGKLHTLRRAIERNPEDWFSKIHSITVRSAERWDGKWIPNEYYSHLSYQGFVRKVLQDLGYIENPCRKTQRKRRVMIAGKIHKFPVGSPILGKVIRSHD